MNNASPVAFALLCALSACATTYRPGQSARFAIDSAAEIDDEDVRKAFEAKPQLPARFSVAYYSFDEGRAGDIAQMLAKIQGVTSVYRIPPLIVTGARRFHESRAWQAPTEVSLKKLRLLAARAKADLLIVVDAGYRSGGANPLAAFNMFVLPVFFVPFLDNRVESYLEAFVIDTRNGYLYGHLSDSVEGGPQFATIYADDVAERAAAQWAALRQTMAAAMNKLVKAERAASRQAPAPAPTARALVVRGAPRRLQ